jgi:hypothetical protein
VRLRDGYLAPEDLGLIGDGTTSALVGLDGSIPCLCLPRLDSEPLFCGLLDGARGGSFTVAPDEVIELVDITAVEVIAPYTLRLTFADGTIGDVDFTAHEWRGVFEPLRDPDYFARVEVDPEAGTITWPDGLDMAPEPLYDEARRHRVASVAG